MTLITKDRPGAVKKGDYLNPNEFKEHQIALNLNNAALAKRLNVSTRSVEHWRAGSRSIPGPVVVLMGLWRKENPCRVSSKT